METENKYVYQTIKEFLVSPFGLGQNMEKDMKYKLRYDSMNASSKIKVEGYTSISDDYYIHLKVPSESDSTRIYDVVIRFFNPDRKVFDNLGKYYIQFFSNSPGFMFQYAVLYKLHGFLIEDLYNKMDPEFINKLPEKSNPNMKMTYDSSIYFACKFLSESNFHYLSKFGVILQKKKSPDDFFKAISSFKEIKQQMNTPKKDTQKVVITHKKKRTVLSGIKLPKLSTSKESGIHRIVKKTGKSSVVKKKTARKSTNVK